MSHMKQCEMLFVGVSTGHSFVRKVFSGWCRALGVEATLRTLDMPLGSSPDAYRNLVGNIRNDDFIRGACITTHKSALYEAAHSMFDEIHDGARDLQEAAAVFKTRKGLACEATDPLSVVVATEEILRRRGIDGWADVFIIGGGGSGLALAYALLQNAHLTPKRLFVSDIIESRVQAVRRVLGKIKTGCQVNVIHCQRQECDELIGGLNQRSLIVNATGMGKDRPGSPVSVNCELPYGSTLWDFNYRGERLFLEIGKQQESARKVLIEDGWHYFICGWLQVMSRVFDVAITPEIYNSFVTAALEQR